MENLKRIQENLRQGYYTTSPHEAAQDRSILSGEYAWICSQLETILQRKPAIWNEIRKSVKSDTACERVWEQTTDGLDEQGLRLRLKGCDKMMQGLGSILKLAEGESKNLY